MKALGIVRNIDNLGRVTIPKEWRTTMGVSAGDPLEAFATKDEITFRKYRPGCFICGGVEAKLLEVRGVNICQECGGKVVDKMSGEPDE